ncbi:flagellar basal-body rod protein FlgG [Nitratiruptor sp. YY08-26]|uniref:flagellar hook-basal body protein n=1 Tax=unclassified Nitratiruptor TaxID=2624044 RepID=UPI0019155E70|nr:MULTISPECIES: flagellar hook-basal body protein [unclassified Nitratiruptor]BCD61848.1 flagellar basal-body rod protein FlgG [Nitratiruptor sp. YY08-13]BCD65783.1 flagellar basal-body rod protein FlgG [Nitratiruptor sp. YY08-26]
MALDMQSIYILASGGSRAMEQLDTTTNNIANANTDGFKKLLIKEMSQRLDENGGDANHLFVFPRFQETLIDMKQGPLRQTGNPLDFAIEGNGYFLVQKGGEKILTRSGHFFLNEEGYLVDKNGNFLLDDRDKPIKLDSRKRLDLGEDGTIYQQGEAIAKLQIKGFAKIEPMGDTYYLAKGSERPATYKLKQGFLEGSNLNPIVEMTSLITAQKRFEMYSNMIKSLEQLNQKTNEIGKA